MRRTETAEGQKPFAIILTCSDSRLAPEVMFDEGIGDLFTVRVAGNTGGDALIIGSMEYSVVTFGSVLLMVLGHTDCGAVKATIEPAVQAVQGQPADQMLDAATLSSRWDTVR